MKNEFKAIDDRLKDTLEIYKYMVEKNFEFEFRLRTLITRFVKMSKLDCKRNYEGQVEEISLSIHYKDKKRDFYSLYITYNLENNETFLKYNKNKSRENSLFYEEKIDDIIDNFKYIVDDVIHRYADKRNFYSIKTRVVDRIAELNLRHRQYMYFFQYTSDKEEILKVVSNCHEAYKMKVSYLKINMKPFTEIERLELAINSLPTEYGVKRTISENSTVKVDEDGKLEYFEEDGKKYYPFRVFELIDKFFIRWTNIYTLKGTIAAADNNKIIFINKEQEV